MLKNFVRGKCQTKIGYYLDFDLDDNSGFSFPCDEQGKVLNLPPEAEKNLAYCLSHPEEFIRFGEIVPRKISWHEPDSGECSCGKRIELTDQYYGACQCPYCGKWYNLFGQGLLPPDQWETDPSEDLFA